MPRVLAEGDLGGVEILRHGVALVQRVLAWPSPGRGGAARPRTGKQWDLLILKNKLVVCMYVLFFSIEKTAVGWREQTAARMKCTNCPSPVHIHV
jgi:hypothetical protein